MSKPGVILKRPVGSDSPFKEDADLSALDEAEREHAKRVAAIDAERAAVERKSQAEDARGDKEKGKLQSAGRETRRSIP
jgi:hypothetical protein